MRIVHILVAIGIALVANAIEPAWLGFIALLALLSAYAYLVVRQRGKKDS